MRRSRLWRLPIVLAVVSATATCKSGGGGTDVTGTVTLTVSLVSGNAQTATVGQAVASAPAVKVTTSSGVAQVGVAVTFSVTGGGGTVTGGTQTTGADGSAQVGGWKLGNSAGANSLSATVANATGSPVSFTATGTPGPAAALAKFAGDAGTASAGAPLTTKPSVKVTDAFSNGVSGVSVVFSVASGGGSVANGTQTTGADGTATVGNWILGNLAGANTLVATVTGTALTSNTTLTFTATGVAGPIAAFTKVAGDALTDYAGALLGTPPAVRASDQFGNLIGGLGVAFAIATGGGSATGTSATTGGNGVATVGGWTLGATPGANTMTATAAPYSVTFTATALAALNAAQYAGTYTGTWRNDTYASTGTGTALVTLNTGSTATVTVNVVGPVLGGGGVTNQVNTGGYANNGVSFTGNGGQVGTISATLTPAGLITASGSNVPNANYPSWTATGTITAATLNLTFIINVAGGGTATGSISLHKP